MSVTIHVCSATVDSEIALDYVRKDISQKFMVFSPSRSLLHVGKGTLKNLELYVGFASTM